jgi:hypothetical protein
MTGACEDVGFLYVSKIKYQFCGHLATLELDGFTFQIMYRNTDILEGTFFNRNIIDVFERVIAMP